MNSIEATVNQEAMHNVGLTKAKGIEGANNGGTKPRTQSHLIKRSGTRLSNRLFRIAEGLPGSAAHRLLLLTVCLNQECRIALIIIWKADYEGTNLREDLPKLQELQKKIIEKIGGKFDGP